jgi:hypothetical protein
MDRATDNDQLAMINGQWAMTNYQSENNNRFSMAID